jgi:nicotinamide-nucleotide amidase
VNCVLVDIALQMSKAVAKKFNSHWGIAVTGYALPVPALRIKSCYAFCAIVNTGGLQHCFKIESQYKDQLKNQKLFVEEISKEFLSYLKTY